MIVMNAGGITAKLLMLSTAKPRRFDGPFREDR